MAMVGSQRPGPQHHPQNRPLGAEDRVTPLRSAALPLVEHLADIWLHVLGRCGHVPVVERPRDLRLYCRVPPSAVNSTGKNPWGSERDSALVEPVRTWRGACAHPPGRSRRAERTCSCSTWTQSRRPQPLRALGPTGQALLPRLRRIERLKPRLSSERVRVHCARRSSFGRNGRTQETTTDPQPKTIDDGRTRRSEAP